MAQLIVEQYETGDDVALWVDRVGPFNNPQEFYMYFGLPYCKPQENKGKLEGIGESILGYELRRAPMSVSFGGEWNIFSIIFKAPVGVLT